MLERVPRSPVPASSDKGRYRALPLIGINTPINGVINTLLHRFSRHLGPRSSLAVI